jgi:WhiB family redox-sensing transcriptional regulator
MAITSLRPTTWNSEEWRELGSCRQLDTALFFPIGQTGEAEVKIARAKKVCVTCPVRQQCLEFAITTNQEYGVWGGHSEEERRVIRRQWRARQRAAAKASFAS